MERKLLLVFALTFLAIMLFQPLLKKYMPQPPAKTESPQTVPAQTPVQPPMPAGATSTAAGALAKNAPAVTQQQAASESETVIENGLYRIVFTNRGAHVRSWVLKKYTDDQGKPLELVNSTAAAKYGYPLSLWSYDEGLRDRLNSALYVTTSTSATAPSEITFTYADGDVAVQKTFRFDHSYVVEARTSVVEKGAEVTAFLIWPAGFGDQTNASQYGYGQVVYQYNGNVERLAIKKVSGGNTLPGPFHWAGISDQYFAAVFLPGDPQSAAMVTLRNTIEIPHSTDRENKQMDKVDVLGAAVGSLKGMTAERIYVGPKSLPDLESVKVPGITGKEPDLRALIDFGSILGPIARVLFLWLKWTTKYVPNWGWAIVIQTIIINLALLPLRLSQMKSMLKMQRVAPQIKAIQEKYKKYSLRDPKKAAMNEEISALYKKEGVNPVGGCLPLIIQMPFLFAYYRMLGVAIDLRHAPWLWIHDLSAPDPHYILPIAIVVTMFAMQRMTPQAGMDPAQQKMMNFMMPVVLGYVSFNLAAGLCLYWAMGQLIGIVQQMALNRSALGREMREMMEKRARKKEK
jgi:YidC/Oxa1 family membrane protein insertase